MHMSYPIWGDCKLFHINKILRKENNQEQVKLGIGDALYLYKRGLAFEPARVQ